MATDEDTWRVETKQTSSRDVLIRIVSPEGDIAQAVVDAWTARGIGRDLIEHAC